MVFVLTPNNHCAHEVNKEENEEFAFGIQVGAKAEERTRLEKLTSLAEDCFFGFYIRLEVSCCFHNSAASKIFDVCGESKL